VQRNLWSPLCHFDDSRLSLTCVEEDPALDITAAITIHSILGVKKVKWSRLFTGSQMRIASSHKDKNFTPHCYRTEQNLFVIMNWRNIITTDYTSGIKLTEEPKYSHNNNRRLLGI